MSEAEVMPGATRADNRDPFLRDVLAGLALPQKAVPARWLYDLRGSELFEEITTLDEYYPTRIETALLEDAGPELARLAPGRLVVEFGSGSSVKTRLLLRAAAPAGYVPIDISGDFLRDAARALAGEFPGLPVLPLEGDFMKPLSLPAEAPDAPRLGFFPGSTIGNLVPPSAVDLLRSMRRTLGEGSRLLIGFDRIKQAQILEAAYDDARGVTAAFNRNLIERINRELAGDIPADAFAHRALWNDAEARVEMHLVACRDVEFSITGQGFAMRRGETIHTENSHKYGPRGSGLLLRAGGWTPVAQWSDEREWFTLILAETTPLRSAP